MKPIKSQLWLSLIAGAASLFCATQLMAECANPAEYSSLNMRALQSELMVAALACGQRESYNHFVKSPSSNLVTHGQHLRSYFSRQYGGRGEYHMNKFVTQMANQASRISLNQSSSAYCQQAAELFDYVRHAGRGEITRLAADRYTAWHNVASCHEAVVAEAR